MWWAANHRDHALTLGLAKKRRFLLLQQEIVIVGQNDGPWWLGMVEGLINA
jgi:hypothetical protein